jgi:anti-sigma factor RsiW
MHSTDHLTDAQLNEYLDNELANRPEAEFHLSTCDNCAARLTALQALFNEIESLPEIALTRDLAASITSRVRMRGVLPRSLCLTVTLQAALAAIAIIFAAPLVMQFASPYFPRIQVPSFADIFLQAQTLRRAWLDSLSQFQLPTLPEIPVIELSSWYILLMVAAVSVLWLVGNRLLLRNQNK